MTRVQVPYDELPVAAAVLREEGEGLLGLAAARLRLLGDGDLLACAVLDPGGFARAEAALLVAVTGPEGLTAAGLALELRAGQLLVVVARYRAADAVAAELVDARAWLVAAAQAAPVAVGAVWGAAAHGLLDQVDRELAQHPGVVDELTGSVGGLTQPLRDGLLGPGPLVADAVFRAVSGQTLLPRDVVEAAGLLALLYAGATPVLTHRPDSSRTANAVPAGVGDLLARLDHRNGLAVGGRSGDIGLTRVTSTGPDGVERVAWVMDLPGTKAWQPVPGPRTGVNDLASNLELMAGEDNARVAAVVQVLGAAGVAPDEPVMLVGHSQGGMVAVRAAQELRGRYAVTHVVTAGSPVGAMAAPPGVQVLSLENRYDLVPRTDGRENADSADHVTVTFDAQTGSVAGNHALSSAYVPAARRLDVEADDAVLRWLETADAFLQGPGEQATASTTVYTVSARDDGR